MCSRSKPSTWIVVLFLLKKEEKIHLHNSECVSLNILACCKITYSLNWHFWYNHGIHGFMSSDSDEPPSIPGGFHHLFLPSNIPLDHPTCQTSNQRFLQRIFLL